MLPVTFYAMNRLFGLESVTPREDRPSSGEFAQPPPLHFITSSLLQVAIDCIQIEKTDAHIACRVVIYASQLLGVHGGEALRLCESAPVQLCGVFRVESPKELRAKPSLGSGQSRPANIGAQRLPIPEAGGETNRAGKLGSPQ